MAAEAQDTARDLSTDESAGEGSLPAIMGISNIDGTNDGEDEKPFPDTRFPFFKPGSDINPTIIQNREWMSCIWKRTAYETPSNSFFTKNTLKNRQRPLYEHNSLGMDERHLNGIDDPEEFWTAVWKIAPPRPWMDPSKVMKYLTRVRPMDMPSKSRPWQEEANPWLNAAIKQGSYNGWKDDADICVDKTEPEFWEAIRIVGDSRDGYGIFPSKLRNKIERAGFAWIFAKPEERILPKCWEKYAFKAGLRFYKSVSVVHQESDTIEAANFNPAGKINTTDLKPASFRSERSSATSLSTLVPQVLRAGTWEGSIVTDIPDLYKRAERGGSAYLEGSQMQHRVLSKDKAQTLPRAQPATPAQLPRPTVEGEPFVEPNFKAANALRSMRTKDAGDIEPPPCMTISRPTDYANAHHLWAATEQNIAQLSANLTNLQNLMPDEVEKVVFTGMKHAIDDGPVEGKIREVLATTLKRAGLQNKDVMQSTIEELVAISTERDRKVIGSVQEAIEKFTERLEALERKIYMVVNSALEHTNMAQGNSAAKIKTEQTYEPDHHQDTSQQVNPAAQTQPIDSQHTTQVIPRKRKNIWEQ
ncbi:hypothetical protein EV127DRAFT_482968 [Xylaria flabelliformis]|nr:hypothetical protein EV127DRAFT_482968 [Xylaria flabelliformis]